MSFVYAVLVPVTVHEGLLSTSTKVLKAAANNKKFLAQTKSLKCLNTIIKTNTLASSCEAICHRLEVKWARKNLGGN